MLLGPKPDRARPPDEVSNFTRTHIAVLAVHVGTDGGGIRSGEAGRMGRRDNDIAPNEAFSGAGLGLAGRDDTSQMIKQVRIRQTRISPSSNVNFN